MATLQRMPRVFSHGEIISVQNTFLGWAEDIPFPMFKFIVMNCNQRQFNGEIAIKRQRKHFFGS